MIKGWIVCLMILQRKIKCRLIAATNVFQQTLLVCNMYLSAWAMLYVAETLRASHCAQIYPSGVSELLKLLVNQETSKAVSFFFCFRKANALLKGSDLFTLAFNFFVRNLFFDHCTRVFCKFFRYIYPNKISEIWVKWSFPTDSKTCTTDETNNYTRLCSRLSAWLTPWPESLRYSVGAAQLQSCPN